MNQKLCMTMPIILFLLRIAIRSRNKIIPPAANRIGNGPCTLLRWENKETRVVLPSGDIVSESSVEPPPIDGAATRPNSRLITFSQLR